ncbi:MAG: amidohydrolase family protein [Alphaproteobacteria bacterium]
MVDTLIRNATLADGRRVDIAIEDGRFSDISSGILAESAGQVIEAEGNLVTAPFVDAHFHADATLSCGIPRRNMSGTLIEGIELWGELAPTLTVDAMVQRARHYCDWAVSMGLLHIRSHVDVSDPKLLGVEALLQLRDEMKGRIDLQLVAFPQQGFYARPDSPALLERALDMGVDVVGGIPHFERTMRLGRESVEALCAIADKRGLMVDLHCDETDDPLSRHVETLVHECFKRGMAGRVAGSHLTSMHSMDNYYFSKLRGLMVEAGATVIPNPVANLLLMGRHDTYPKRRGMARVPELLESGIPVALGQDSVLDPWNPLGNACMLEVAFAGVLAAQMTGVTAMQQAFDCVTTGAAQVMGLQGYGITPGNPANLVMLDCADAIEAIRLKPNRLLVMRDGKTLSTMPARLAIVMGSDGQRTMISRRHDPA